MKKRVLSALLALCLTLSLAGAAFAENEASGASSSAASQAVSSVEPESQAQDKTVSSSSVSGEDQASAKTESTPAPTQTPAASDVTKEESESTAAPEATEEPEATAEPDATPAPTEDPEAEVTEKTETDGSVEYTAALETDDQTLNVIVTAPDGAFAEGVEPQLSVTMLTAEDELNDVANKLTDAEVKYDGFAALDITFTDKATGEEIEPVQQVSVRIELPQAIVDSGIDLNTLAVQHLEEDENGDVKNVNEVATLDNGITLSEEAAAAANEAAGVAPMSDMPAEEATAAVAEFEVNGFSSFVITWVNYDDGWNTASLKVVIRNADTHQEMDIPGLEVSEWDEYLSDNTTITVEQLVGSLNTGEYEFQYATYYTAQNGNEQKFLSVRALRSDVLGDWSNKPRYHFYFNGSSDYVRVNESKATVYLYYKENEPEGPGGDQGGTGTTSATVTTGKSAVKIGDTDNYTLNLSISGDRGSEEKTQPVDVLFILDTSGSMDDSNVKYNNQYMTLINALKSVLTGSYNGYAGIGGLIGSIEANQNIDVQYSVVSFAGAKGNNTNGSVVVQQDWTESASDTVSKIRGLKANGGTNYQQGILKGNEQLNKSAHTNRNATTFVIFVTDGEPTFYGQNDQGKGDEFDSTALSRAQTALKDTKCDYFYAIGIGSVFSNENSTAYQRLDTLKGYVGDNIPGSSTIGRTFAAGDDMTGAFDSILKNITFFEANNVTVVDPLSEYADLVPNASGQYEITLQLEKRANADAEYEKTGEPQTVQIGANGSGKTVTLSDGNETVPLTVYVDKGQDGKETIRIEFAGNYRLAQNYRYTASTTITPSDAAKAATMDSDAAKSTPDPDTGTHADKNELGFWSNDNANAKVIFDAITTNKDNQIIDTDPGKTALFPKPVIQVPEIKTGNLIIKKTVVGLDEETLNTLKDTLTFELSPSVGETSSVKLSNFTKDEANSNSATKTFTYTYTFANVPTDSYTIKETDYKVEKYDCTTDPADQVKSVTVAGNSDTEAAFTNTYTRQTGTLVLDKAIDGIDNADQTAVENLSFAFTVTGPKDADGVVVVNDADPEKVVKFVSDGNEAKVNVQITVGETITIDDLPTGSYTVTETVPSERVTTSNYEIVNGKYYFASATGDGTVAATVEKSKSTTAKIVNSYKPYKTLTIKKVTIGTMETDNDWFDFDVTAPEHVTFDPTSAQETTTSGYDFKLNNGNTITLAKLKENDSITIRENGNVNGYTAKGVAIAEGSILKDADLTDEQNNSVTITIPAGNDVNLGTVVFTNERNAVAPTGLEDNHTKPFGLMVGVAVMAGLTLVGGAVVRRRRRWME